MLDRTEVFFGSGSTQYGSDALGGVIYMKTRDPLFRNQKFGFVSANANFRYLSASNAVISNVNLELAGKRVAWLLSTTSSDFGDLRMGQRSNYSAWDTFGLRKNYVARINNRDTQLLNNDPFTQKGTAYKQDDIFSKLSVKTGRLVHTLNVQLSKSPSVPRYDRLTDTSGGALRFTTWKYTPQSRSFMSYTLQLPQSSKLKHRIILSNQQTEVGRVTRQYRNDNELTQQDKVRMSALNYDYQYDLIPSLQFQGGIELVQNDVNSKANQKNVATGVEASSNNTRYANGGAQTFSAALFTNAIWVIKPNDFIIEGGFRFTHYQLQAKFSPDNFLKLPYDKAEIRSLSPVYNLGLTKKMDVDGLFFKASLANGFRNPNVDDMTKLFESVSGSKLVIPNRDLKPERTRTFDIGFRYDVAKNSIEFGGYYTKISKLLMDRKSSYQGFDSLIYDGKLTPVYQMDNTAGGYVTGAYLAAKIKLVKNLYLNANYTTTYGRYRQTETSVWVPIDHIAPDHGKLGLRWISANWQCEAYMLFNGWKLRKDYSPSGEDNAQYAPGGQTPSWQTYNFRTSWQVSELLTASFAAENLLDLNYRVFSSGMNAPGRNLSCSIKLAF